MRFSYAESMCDPAHYAPLARGAEEAGYSSMTVPDSICYPETSDTSYPYTPDGGREFLEGKPFIDPFVLISALAAITERLRFTTFVLKLPVRQPVIVAKQATSIAVLSDNRLGLGIGLSPWPEDFRVTQTEWKARGKRMDEMIEILRGLTTGEYFGFQGEHYDIERIKLTPAPTKPIPLLIGGHSEAALRRAARLGDGWMHAGSDAETLDALIGRLKALRAEYGRQNDPFEIHAISMEELSLDQVKDLEDRGVTDMIVAFRNAYEKDDQSVAQKLAALRGFAEHVIAKL
jgi:probable F420-dependent oxidoreductase